MKTVRVVAAVLKTINQNGQPIIFATQLGYGDFKGDREFTGGKIENDETPTNYWKKDPHILRRIFIY